MRIDEFIKNIFYLISHFENFETKKSEEIYQEIVNLWNFKKEDILAHTIENNYQLLEYKKYKTAELFTELIYPKYKFSEFGRNYLAETNFNVYYEKIMDPRNWHSYDRKYNLKELLKQTRNLTGDIVECGVYKGASAILMCEEALIAKNSLVHLFDSFEGLSKPDKIDGNYWTEGRFEINLDELYENLKNYKNYRVYKGWIPEEFYHVTDRQFKFVHIDVDLYKPSLDSLKFFYPRLNLGGIILLDDYGFYSCPGATLAVDEFCKKEKIQVSTLSSGQGLIIRNNV